MVASSEGGCGESSAADPLGVHPLDESALRGVGFRHMRASLQSALFGKAHAGDPARLGRFEVRGRLGSGGMGTVYLAHDPKLDREVALKVMRRDQDDRTDRLLREARALASLNHPYVVTIYEVGELEHGEVFLAMEGVEIRMLDGSIEVHSDTTVVAMGVPDDPIVITSAAAVPSPGDWGCMFAPFAEPLNLHNVIFEYGGSGIGCHGSSIEASLAEVPADSTIVDSTFRHGAGAGISGGFGVCDRAWCTNTFEDNVGVDIVCPGSDPPSLSC